MLVVVTISPQSLAYPPSSRKLTNMAAHHELVLVGAHDVAPNLVCAVRALLPRHRVVALLVDRVLTGHEHDLLQEVVNDGHLPMILTTGEPTAVQLSAWLDADSDLALPTGANMTRRRLARAR